MTGAGDSRIRVFDDAGSARMLEAFEQRYTTRYPVDTEAGQKVAHAEIHERQFWFRERYVPWLDSVVSLRGARVLEIGSGNGSSTVALAEAGAVIDALDVDADGLMMAVPRAELCGVRHQIQFQVGDAADVAELFPAKSHDVIAYLAALEHMTFAERTTSLQQAWTMLGPGGILVIADTPNRLWYFDDHTSFDNYFHWLPDDVALSYVRLAPRRDFGGDFEASDAALRLTRWGRGISYHDLMIAIGEDVLQLYVSGEWDFRRQRDPDFATWWSGTTQGRYQALLREISPEVPSGFLEPELAVCLRKPA
jgi:S-adenosylmethionine-dependent methyltransferase